MRVAGPRADEVEVADGPSDDEGDDGGQQQHPLDGPVAIWGDGHRSECPTCHACSAHRTRKRRAATCGPHPEGYDQWAMVADGETDEGTVLLCQTAGSPRALWPIAGQGWTPPSPATTSAANARWTVVRCQHCQDFRRFLTSTRHIPD
eukprot:10050964-Lingulodinium_polyedra.AAC.1